MGNRWDAAGMFFLKLPCSPTGHTMTHRVFCANGCPRQRAQAPEFWSAAALSRDGNDSTVGKNAQSPATCFQFKREGEVALVKRKQRSRSIGVRIHALSKCILIGQ